MLKVKLNRIGRKAQPQYRVVVAEARSNMGGNVIADVGYYNPLTEPATFNLDEKAYAEWLKKGAQPTDTVRLLAKKSVKTSK